MKLEEKLVLHGRIVEMMKAPRATISSVARRLHCSWATVRSLIVPPTTAKRSRAVSAKVLRRREVVSRVVRHKRKVGIHEFRKYPSAKAIGESPELKELGEKRSAETIRRDLHALGYAPVVRKFVPARNPEVARRRLQFCKEWLGRGRKDDLTKVVFSDEHWVSCNDSSHRLMWARKNDEILTRERKRAQNVPRFQIWAAIGMNYKSDVVLFPVKSGDFFGEQAFRLDSEGYVKRCLSKVKNELAQDRIFMQDGASAHTSKSTRAYLAKSNLKFIDNWPPYSPDLNPIEQLWAILNHRIAEDHHPQTYEELRNATVQAWNAIPMPIINNLVESFASKLRKTQEKGGYP